MATKKSTKVPSDKFYSNASDFTVTPSPEKAAGKKQSFKELPFGVDDEGNPLPPPEEP